MTGLARPFRFMDDQAFNDALTTADWCYHYSDDHRVYLEWDFFFRELHNYLVNPETPDSRRLAYDAERRRQFGDLAVTVYPDGKI